MIKPFGFKSLMIGKPGINSTSMKKQLMKKLVDIGTLIN